jgi:CRP-like cAMP-binding protein
MLDHFPHLIHLGDGSQFIERFASIIDRIRLFEDFEYQEVRRLALRMPCYRALPGTVLIREGDAGDFTVLMLSGRVNVIKRDASGHHKHIGDAGPGDTLGEMSMIDGQPRIASCIVEEETEFAVLDRDELTRIIAEDQRLGVKVLVELVQHLSRKLRVASAKLAELLAV